MCPRAERSLGCWTTRKEVRLTRAERWWQRWGGTSKPLLEISPSPYSRWEDKPHSELEALITTQLHRDPPASPSSPTVPARDHFSPTEKRLSPRAPPHSPWPLPLMILTLITPPRGMYSGEELGNDWLGPLGPKVSLRQLFGRCQASDC